MANSTSGDAVIERLVRVLSAFSVEDPSLSVAQIARKAGIPQSTAYRLANDLMRHDLLQKDPTGRLRVGMGMWELANRASSVMEFAALARPHMAAVHQFVGENTQLGILRGREVLFLERMSRPSAVVHRSRTAGRLPAHASSCGLLLLAHAPRRVREAYLRGPLAAFTPSTTTDPAQLAKQLEQIHAAQVASLVSQIDEGVAGVAVPIYGPDERAVGAVGAVGAERARVQGDAGAGVAGGAVGVVAGGVTGVVARSGRAGRGGRRGPGSAGPVVAALGVVVDAENNIGISRITSALRKAATNITDELALHPGVQLALGG